MAPEIYFVNGIDKKYPIIPITNDIIMVEKAIGNKLNHGDVVVFGGNRYTEASFVIKTADRSEKKFIANVPEPGAGRLNIPLAVTSSMMDAVGQYKAMMTLIPNDIYSIALHSNDISLKDVPTRIREDYRIQFFYIPSTNMYGVQYGNKYKEYEEWYDVEETVQLPIITEKDIKKKKAETEKVYKKFVEKITVARQELNKMMEKVEKKKDEILMMEKKAKEAADLLAIIH